MYLDVTDLRDFYATMLGRIVRRNIQARMAGVAGGDPGRRILGFGFATPYLAGLGHEAERVLAFMPAGQGVMDWPAEGGSATALVEEDALPLPDGSMDLVVLVHALEMSPRPHALLAEARRILGGGGGLVCVAPNRQSPWARSDVSPFGFGRPYSRGQLRGLFTEAGFEAQAWTTALHMPPTARRALIGVSGLLEGIGQVVWPAFSGVIIVSATKRTVQGARVRARPSLAQALRPALRPSPGLAGRDLPG